MPSQNRKDITHIKSITKQLFFSAFKMHFNGTKPKAGVCMCVYLSVRTIIYELSVCQT